MKQESKTEGDPGRLRSEERNVGNKDEVSRKQSGGYRITCKNTGILIVCVCVSLQRVQYRGRIAQSRFIGNCFFRRFAPASKPLKVCTSKVRNASASN